MKIRTDFVTNSSSSSFTIRKDGLTSLQKALIENYAELAKYSGLEYPECACDWFMEQTDTKYLFDTDMDNFDLVTYMEKAGIPEENMRDEPDKDCDGEPLEVSLEECIKYFESLPKDEDNEVEN